MAGENANMWARMQEVSLDLADHAAAIDAFLTKRPKNEAMKQLHASLLDRLDTIRGEIDAIEQKIAGDQLQELRAELEEQKRQRMALKRVLKKDV